MEIYVVQIGDTVSSIAAAYGVAVDSLIYANQLKAPYNLVQGQALLIVGENPDQNKPNINTNGYAYPFISSWVLNQTLPYLTRLSIFSYGFTSMGNLLPPELEEQWMIDAARGQNVLSILTLTPFGPDGRFNNQLISEVINNTEAVQQLIAELDYVMRTKGYAGVDIDFEYILAEDRDAFSAFVSTLTQQLNALGYTVSVALAPKTSATQTGLLYEGKDYAALGQAANSVLLMTYEWGYTYGPAMAVAPINMVRRVVEYAVTQIPAEKIDLGIPNYGYDFILPYERGVSKAKTIGNIEAVQLALRVGAQIQFDEVAKSPFFNYYEDGRQHEVWFEDVRSMKAKFDLIKEFGLLGAGYWQIMQLFRANWLLLSGIFTIDTNQF